jgi:hypothetical protein
MPIGIHRFSYSKLYVVAVFFGIVRATLLFYNNPNLVMNFDEESNFRVAMSNHIGKGYTYNNYPSKVRKKTAFHSSFPIFTYEFLIKQKIKKKQWVVFCNLASSILLSISIVVFFKLCKYIFIPQIAFYTTLLYCIFPSILYYIGTLFWYEQIFLSVLVFIVYYLFKLIAVGKLNPLNWLILSICAVVSSLFRLHTLPIILLLFFCTAMFLALKHQIKNTLILILLSVIVLLSHVPSLQKNHALFGSYIISTQFGYEVLQGHNPHARGSWMGDFLKPDNILYKYAHENINSLDSLNEYDEGKARLKLSISWMSENPLNDLRLEMRKLVLFFAPFNFEFLPFHHFFNPINLIVYVGFLIFILLLVSKKIKTESWQTLILLIPIFCSIVLTLLFFMGARWRYYAEPFMIIFAVLSFQHFYFLYRNKTNRCTQPMMHLQIGF